MTLMLKEDQSYCIAIRHFANSILGNIQRIDDEKNGIGLRYVDQLVYRLIDKLTEIQRKMDTLSYTVLEQGTKFADAELIKYEEEYKLACYELVKALHAKREELKRDQDKFEGLLVEVISLGKRSISDFMTESRSRKNDRVAELEETVPTFPKIASVLRLHELEQSSIYNVCYLKLDYKAVRMQEEYMTELKDNEEEGNGNVNLIDSYYANVEDELREEMDQLAFEVISPVLLDNESKTNFIKNIIPVIADNFLAKNGEKLKAYYKEQLELA
ncbi:TPA: hypothetical protein ACGWER_001739 [Streptococcus agalactiae]